MLPQQKLDALVARHKAVESELASQLTPETYVKLSREFAELGPVVDAVKSYRGVVSEIEGLDALIAACWGVANLKDAGEVSRLAAHD